MAQNLAIHELHSDTSISSSTWSCLQRQSQTLYCADTEHTVLAPSDTSAPWYSLSYHVSSFPKITGTNTKLAFYRKRCHACRVQFLLLGMQQWLRALAVHGMNVSLSTELTAAPAGKHTRALLSTGGWGRHSSRQGYGDLYRIWQK